jgi:Raf kinase inhibitor-like YbhB/YbcL family protein
MHPFSRLATVCLLACAVIGPAQAKSKKAKAAPFILESAEIAPNGTIANEQVFNGFGCTGGNVSPSLKWSGAPAGTKSFALLVHDPDAPTGGAGWWHWVVVNIPAKTTALPKGVGTVENANHSSGAREIRTDFGTPAWGGPCPPVGDKPHHYRFTLYALGVEKLDLPADASASLAGFMVNANAIGRATLTGRYGRSADDGAATEKASKKGKQAK